LLHDTTLRSHLKLTNKLPTHHRGPRILQTCQVDAVHVSDSVIRSLAAAAAAAVSESKLLPTRSLPRNGSGTSMPSSAGRLARLETSCGIAQIKTPTTAPIEQGNPPSQTVTPTGAESGLSVRADSDLLADSGQVVIASEKSSDSMVHSTQTPGGLATPAAVAAATLSWGVLQPNAPNLFGTGISSCTDTESEREHLCVASRHQDASQRTQPYEDINPGCVNAALQGPSATLSPQLEQRRTLAPSNSTATMKAVDSSSGSDSAVLIKHADGYERSGITHAGDGDDVGTQIMIGLPPDW
jgi:hypothetical protein